MRGYKEIADFDPSEFKDIDLATYPVETFETPYHAEWVPSEKALREMLRKTSKITAKEIREKRKSIERKLRIEKERHIHSSIIGEENFQRKKSDEWRMGNNWYHVKEVRQAAAEAKARERRANIELNVF